MYANCKIEKLLFDNTFNKKKVFVTGHTGFKGSWLTLWLKQLGAEIIGYSLEPDTNPNIFEALQLQDKITHIIGDVRDLNHLKQSMHEHKPDIVLHLAAQPLVKYSYQEPHLTYETNVMGTVNVFEAVRSTSSVKAVVNVTTDKCYENKEWVYGYRETDRLGGYDPYSSSKALSELVTSSYRNSFFNPAEYGVTHNVALASARAGNVIGGGDWSLDRLIPDCARYLSEGQEIVIRNPIATRPWQHVLEPLAGYLQLAAKLYNEGVKYADGWNLGPHDNSVLTVGEVVQKAIQYWGSGNCVLHENKNAPHEANLLKLDISKAVKFLGWAPAYDIDEAVSETMLWYKAYYSKNVDMYDYSAEQLNKYIQASQKAELEWSCYK